MHETLQEQVFMMTEADVDDIIGADVNATCKIAGPVPADTKELSDVVDQQLAEMPNMIEKGAQWLEALQFARTAFQANDPGDTLNPLVY